MFLTIQKLWKAIENATPEQMIEIKKAEQAFDLQMKELDVDVFKMEVADGQDARKHLAKIGQLVLWVLLSSVDFWIHILSNNSTTRTKLRSFDKLSARILRWFSYAVISFYFGASNSSRIGEYYEL